MNKIIAKEQFSEKVFKLVVEAPLIAKARRAGHFVIVRVGNQGERMPLTIADADVAEFVVSEGALVTRQPVMKLGLPKGITIGGIVRGSEGFLVNGSTQILPGDTVVAFCLENNIKKLEQYFK